jgi:hypothetical protein
MTLDNLKKIKKTKAMCGLAWQARLISMAYFISVFFFWLCVGLPQIFWKINQTIVTLFVYILVAVVTKKSS